MNVIAYDFRLQNKTDRNDVTCRDPYTLKKYACIQGIVMKIKAYRISKYNTFLTEVPNIATHFGGYFGILPSQGCFKWLFSIYNSAY